MKRRMLLPIVLGLLGFGLFFTSVAMAGSQQPLTLAERDGTSFQVTITPTTTITDTPTTTSTFVHPVASAMAEFFGEDCSVIETLHQDGYGFGVIAHAYFVARQLPDMTAMDLLAEFDSGLGWGVILKEHALHPGLAGRGGNLGDIMSGHGQSADLLSAAHVPPGQLKKEQPGGAPDMPPGQLKQAGEGDGDDLGHGPPATPPGQDKDKGKGKKH